MTFTVLSLAVRKAGTTHEEFREHYENNHMPLLKSIFGDAFPISHTRYYVKPDEQGNAVTFVGPQALNNVDCYGLLVFEDEAHFGRLMETMGVPENGKKVQEDDHKFLDHESYRVLPVTGPFATTKA